MKTSKFKIEKDVPIPLKNKDSKYPFKDMVVGDSFLTDDKATTVLSASYTYRKRIAPVKFKLLTRPTSDGKVRVWRVL